MVRESTPVEKRPKLHNDSPPFTSVNTTNSSAQPLVTDSATLSPPTASAAQINGFSTADPWIEFLSSDGVSSEGSVQPSQNALSEPHSSLSPPAQPVVDDSEAVRTSLRSKKPTKFFGDPLRHSVKLTEEAQMSQPHIRGPSKDLPSGSASPFSSLPRKPLIHDRFHIDILEVSSISFAEVDKTLIKID